MADLNKALQDLLSRVDAVSGRLQRVEAQLASGAGASSSAPSPSSSSSSSGASSGADHPKIVAFDELVANHLAPFRAASSVVTERTRASVEAFVEAVNALRAVLVVASQSKKPANVVELPVVKALFAACGKVSDAKSAPRNSDPDVNHISALAESVTGFGWILWAKGDPQMDRLPAPVVKEGLDGAVFFLNRLLMAHKPGGKDENPDQVKWVNAFKNFFTELQAYVHNHHTQSLWWNPNGGDAAAAAVPAAAPAPPPPAAAAPPPPPPPSAASSSSGPDARAGLFAALNAGDGVTKGLKKVTRDMQTHKNPELRASSVVPASGPKPAAAAPRRAASAAPSKPPLTELQGNKWVVEWHKGNKSIVIEQDVEPKHVLYCYKLEDCVVHVKSPKINAITIDGCKKTAVVFHNVISGVEVVNSQSVEIQSQGIVPNFAVDKCSSITIYISADSLSSQFVVSKSDSINVIIPDGTESKELYVPEQFLSVIRDGKLVTTTLEHE